MRCALTLAGSNWRPSSSTVSAQISLKMVSKRLGSLSPLERKSASRVGRWACSVQSSKSSAPFRTKIFWYSDWLMRKRRRSRAYFVRSSPKSSFRCRARFARRCRTEAARLVTFLVKTGTPYRAASRWRPGKSSQLPRVRPSTLFSRGSIPEELESQVPFPPSPGT